MGEDSSADQFDLRNDWYHRLFFLLLKLLGWLRALSSALPAEEVEVLTNT